MDLRNRLYPYPVLSRHNDDYIMGDFDIDISHKTNRKEIVFNFETNLTDGYLKRFIDEECATYAVHIECSQTCYRKLISFKETSKIYSIPCDQINDRIQISPYILAKKNIKEYYNPNFNDIYDELYFDIAKGNILAIGTPVRVIVDKDYDSLKNIKSIFCIIPDDRQSDAVLDNISTDLIEIYVPSAQFAVYTKIGKMPYNIPIIHSTLAIPSLIKIFERLKSGESVWEEYEDRKWFRAIKEAFKKKGIDFSRDGISNFDSPGGAQILMDSSILKVFDNMKSVNDADMEDLL